MNNDTIATLTLDECDPVLKNNVTQQANSQLNLDANETIFAQRQLEYVKRTVYAEKNSKLKANDLIPIATDTDPNAESIVYYEQSDAGRAVIISDYANDFPSVDVNMTEKRIRPRDLGNSYGFSVREIRNAQKAGISLSEKKAKAAKRAIDQETNRISLFGDAAYGFNGLVNHPGTTSVILPTGVSASVAWSTKTPEEMINDLQILVDGVSVPTNGLEEVNTILLPRAQYNELRNTKMTGSNDTTALEFFKKNNEGIDIQVLDELKNAGTAGTTLMLAYVKSADHLEQQIPSSFEQLEVQAKGATFFVPCMKRVAGTTVYYPQSIAQAEGI